MTALIVDDERLARLELRRMLAAHPGQCRRIAAGLRGKLRRGREPRGDGQGCAVEKIAAGDRHEGMLAPVARPPEDRAVRSAQKSGC